MHDAVWDPTIVKRVRNIVRTHGCVRNDSEMHETVSLDCKTGEARNAIQ